LHSHCKECPELLPMGLNQCAISPESEGENFYARRDLIWPASSDVLLVPSPQH
jgi:hypothetical protein